MPLEMKQLVNMDLLTMMSKLTERALEILVVDCVPVKGKAQTPLTPIRKKYGNMEKNGDGEKRRRVLEGC